MNKDSNKDKLIGLWLLVLEVLLVWVLALIAIGQMWPKLAERGLFGDSFGMINSLFSGLAFAGIIYTILLQRKELALQRLELAQTREELKRSADAQEELKDQQRRQVANMRVSAQLDAMSSLLNYHMRQEEIASRSNDSINIQESRRSQQELVNRIQVILETKDNLEPL